MQLFEQPALLSRTGIGVVAQSNAVRLLQNLTLGSELKEDDEKILEIRNEHQRSTTYCTYQHEDRPIDSCYARSGGSLLH